MLAAGLVGETNGDNDAVGAWTLFSAMGKEEEDEDKDDEAAEVAEVFEVDDEG